MTFLDFSGWWKTRDGHFAVVDPPLTILEGGLGFSTSKMLSFHGRVTGKAANDGNAVAECWWDQKGNAAVRSPATQANNGLDLMERIIHVGQLPEAIRPKTQEKP